MESTTKRRFSCERLALKGSGGLGMVLMEEPHAPISRREPAKCSKIDNRTRYLWETKTAFSFVACEGCVKATYPEPCMPQTQTWLLVLNPVYDHLALRMVASTYYIFWVLHTATVLG